MQKDIRWGIIGAGNIAGKFASALTYTEGAVLQAVASREADKAESFARKHGSVQFFDSYEALAASPDVDIVYIATPHAFHLEQALLCFRHGKHVLCEKPLTLSEGQSRQMIDAAQKAGCYLAEGMWARHMPAIEKVLAMVKGGELGEIRFIRADFGFQAPKDPGNRLYNIKLGGGSLLDVGVYPIFFTTLMLGEPSGIKADVVVNKGGADETCSIALDYNGKAHAQIFSSITVQTGLTAEVIGTTGRLLLHNPWYKTQRVMLTGTDWQQQVFEFPHELNGFEYEIRAVNDDLRNGRKQSEKMTWEMTLSMSRTMDKILHGAGIRYPGT
jgi:predicted dehydrogenase